MKIRDKNKIDILLNEFEESILKSDFDENTILESQELDQKVRVSINENGINWYTVDSENSKKVKPSLEKFISESDKEDDEDDEDEMDDEDEDKKKDKKKDKVEETIITVNDLNIDEDFSNIFKDSGIDESVVSKLSTLFKATLASKVNEIVKQSKEIMESAFNEKLENFKNETESNIDKYVGYVCNEWINENQIAVQEGIKNEITEDFLLGLKELFETHYVNIPEGKENILDVLESKLQDTEEKLNNVIDENISIKDELNSYRKNIIFEDLFSDTSEVVKEKARKLVETLSFEDSDSFIRKVQDIKESVNDKVYVKTKLMNETLTEYQEEQELTGQMSQYLTCLKRSHI